MVATSRMSSVMSVHGLLLMTSHGSSSRWRGMLPLQFHPQRSEHMKEMRKAIIHTGRGMFFWAFVIDATYSYPFVLTAVANLNEGSLPCPLFSWYAAQFLFCLTVRYTPITTFQQCHSLHGSLACLSTYHHLSVPIAFNHPHSPSSCVHLSFKFIRILIDSRSHW